MNYTATFFLVLLTAIVVISASGLVRRSLSLDTRRRYHEIGNPVYLQIGVMFAVLLAFVFSDVWGEYNAAAQALNGECGALHGAAMLAHELPDTKGLSVDRAILSYSQAVINQEWPTLRNRQANPEVVASFQRVMESAARLDLTRPGDLSVQSQILALLAQAHADRETRIFQANQGVPDFVWFVLMFYTFVLVAFVLFAGVETRVGHMVFAGIFAASIVLVLVRMLDYPFEGPLTLSSSDFVTLMQRVAVLSAG
jgi:hypothetical protein